MKKEREEGEGNLRGGMYQRLVTGVRLGERQPTLTTEEKEKNLSQGGFLPWNLVSGVVWERNLALLCPGI